MQTAPHPQAELLAADPDGWSFWAWEISLTLLHPWTTARDTCHSKRNLVVAVCRDGITGLGEAPPLPRYDETPEGCMEAARSLAGACLSMPVWGHRQFLRRREAVTGYLAAKSAVDAAILDWHGKKAGLPLHALLGLSGGTLPLTSYSIGIDTPDMVEQKIIEAAPYPILKVKLGGEHDREIMTRISALTDKPIRVDANEGWKNADEALSMIRFLEDMNVVMVEQPLPAKFLEDMRWLRDKTRLALIADESTYVIQDLTRLRGAFDGINIKLSKAGGPQAALDKIIIGKSLGMKIMIGCMIESSLGITMAAQLASLADYLDLDGNLLITDDPFVGVTVVDGQPILPAGPGLGVRNR
ncbi:MAG: dipeptide epimerase [Candidatus Sericytochromatia bacterium]|nr:dipeptide epimerase [Candidatus Sericytochromatia bacterium]